MQAERRDLLGNDDFLVSSSPSRSATWETSADNGLKNVIRSAPSPIFRNGHYAIPSLYLEGATIKNDHHGPTDKEMRLSLSVPSAEDTPFPSVQPHR
jgi:hypothetical protein